MFGQQLLNGLSIGLVYGLLAVGLVMVFSTTRIINFAHGELFSLGAFIGLAFQTRLHFAFPLAAILAVGAVFLISAIFTFAISTKLPSALAKSVATIALGLGLRDLMLVTFGSDSESYGGVYPEGALSIGSLKLSYGSVIISVSTVIVLAIVGMLVWRTRWGIFMRAVAQEPDLARTVGIRTRLVQSVSFGAGAALAALAGVLVAPQWQVTYTAGSAVALKAFTAALIGGFYNMTSALWGGIFVGVLETLLAGYISSTWKDLCVFVCLICVLLLRPRGLRGYSIRRLG